MKRKMKKGAKPLSIAILAIFMVLVAAIPSSAAFYQSWGGDGAYLNVWGESVSAGSRVRLYSRTGHSTQNFSLKSAGNGYYFLTVAANSSYAINRDSTYGYAIMWPTSTGAYDSYLSTLSGYSGTTFRLKNYSKGDLTATGMSSGDSVTFDYYSGTRSQAWKNN